MGHYRLDSLLTEQTFGLFSTYQGEGNHEHGGGQGAGAEVGAGEAEGGHEDGAEGLALAEDGAVQGQKGAAVFVGGGPSFSRKAAIARNSTAPPANAA